MYSRSPPPLQHPVPTHPAYIPDPPATPVSPQGYQRYKSSPEAPYQHQNVHPNVSVKPPQTSVPFGYTSPFQHSQQHTQHQPNQQQDPSIPPVNFAAWGMNDSTAQFGIQLGQHAVAAGQEYVQKNFAVPLPTLKHHFSVSNSYVIKKLRIVLFPWTHKPWGRRVRRLEGATSEWATPRDDINSPDLYIPVMALVTYILIAALSSGLRGAFHPKVLGESASRAIAVVLLDWLCVWGGCYFLSVQGVGAGQMVDLVAYGGYKFVGVIATLTAGLVGFSKLYWLIFFYCFFANAFFLLRSLRSVLLPDVAGQGAGTFNSAQRRRRISFLFFEAVVQIFYMGLLVRV